MALENKKNFLQVKVEGTHSSGDTTINIDSSDIGQIPDPATVGNYDMVWWDDTNYPEVFDDPNVEVVTVTAKDSNNETIDVNRGQQGTTATDKNTSGANYKMLQDFYQKDADEIATGASSATDNTLPRFDGTDGKTLQSSGVAVDDSDNINNVPQINGLDAGGDRPKFEAKKTLGSEVGWHMESIRLTQGRFDYDEKGGKCEIRLHGGGGNNFPDLNFLEIDSFANYLKITGGSTQNMQIYGGIQVKFSSRKASGNIRFGGAGGFEGYNGSEWRPLSSELQTETLNIPSPGNSENRTMIHLSRGIDLKEVADVVVGSSSPSIDYNINYASDRNGSATTVFSSDRTANDETGQTTNTFNNSSIPSGNWVWLTTSATSGTVDEFHVSMRYRENI